MDGQERSRLFVDRLESKRRELGMDHRRFAAHLGRSEATWSLVRRGKKGVTLQFARAALAHWPELSSLLAADLAADAPAAPAVVPAVPVAPAIPARSGPEGR